MAYSGYSLATRDAYQLIATRLLRLEEVLSCVFSQLSPGLFQVEIKMRMSRDPKDVTVLRVSASSPWRAAAVLLDEICGVDC